MTKRSSRRRLITTAAASALMASTLATGALSGAGPAIAAHAALPIADVSAFGSAVSYGSTSTVDLHSPVVGMARTVTGLGYWEVAADGGVFSFGDAHFYGSTGGLHLNQPVVGIAATPTGHGYWLTAADGGVFNFGDARFHGSFGSGVPGVGPTYMDFVGMAATPDGGGYWLVASGFCAAEGSTATVSSPPGAAVTAGTLAGVSANRLFGCADQVQFRFSVPAPAATAYQVGYVASPVASPSGLAVTVAGNYFLEVTLHPISSVSYPAFDIVPTGTANVVEMRQTQNFEGYVTWVIGLRHRTPFWVGRPAPGANEYFVVDIAS